jgi:hypothetical protein
VIPTKDKDIIPLEQILLVEKKVIQASFKWWALKWMAMLEQK